jgi:hypothetical protein
MTVAHDETPDIPATVTKRRRRALAQAGMIAILVFAAVILTGLTLPLLGRSLVAFFVVAGLGWSAIFLVTFLVSRSMGRPRPKHD